MTSSEPLSNKIEIVEGNIIKQRVEAIVNAANVTLLGGGGVDGAIHRAAGPRLLEACKKLNGCPTGEARITEGFDLSVKWIIHTVGPIWRGGKHEENEMLARCYRNSLVLAAEHKIHTLAFPSISTGLYRFPIEIASDIALTETLKFVEHHELPTKIIFVCYGHDAYSTYLDSARRIVPGFNG